jgi:hypothetical protein
VQREERGRGTDLQLVVDQGPDDIVDGIPGKQIIYVHGIFNSDTVGAVLGLREMSRVPEEINY